MSRLTWDPVPTTKGRDWWANLKVVRAEVPGGWLVAAVRKRYPDTDDPAGLPAGLTFVPDPTHEWK